MTIFATKDRSKEYAVRKGLNPTDRVIFAVEGSGEFPYEMLSRDHCWPLETADCKLIGSGPLSGHYARRRVSLLTDRGWPSKVRWQSFGWPVVDEYVRSLK